MIARIALVGGLLGHEIAQPDTNHWYVTIFVVLVALDCWGMGEQIKARKAAARRGR